MDPEWLRLPGASAPGKLMVCGEYAVLDGAPSVVAAVGARAVARWSAPSRDGSTIGSGDSSQRYPFPPEAMLARRLAEESLGSVEADLHIDVSDLRKSGRKLGLGSSSAASAATVAAVYAQAGEDLTDPAVQRVVFETALRGHRAVAPQGSGADVAAASLGGFVRFRLQGHALSEVEPTRLPGALRTRVVWTGEQARTSEFVRAVREYEARDGRGYGVLLEQMHQTAHGFVEASGADDAPATVAAAGRYGEHMAELGQAAGVPIVTEELARIAGLARDAGGSAKPSGAGGGDVAIAFFATEDAAADFDRACRDAGLDRLSLPLGDEGVRVEQA